MTNFGHVVVLASIVLPLPEAIAQQGIPDKWSNDHLLVVTMCRGESPSTALARTSPGGVDALVTMWVSSTTVDILEATKSSPEWKESQAKLSCFWRGVLEVPTEFDYLAGRMDSAGRYSSITLVAPGRSKDTAWFWEFVSAKEGERIARGYKPGLWVTSARGLESVNCATGAVTALSAWMWFSDGTSEDVDLGSVVYAPPGSVADQHVNYVCSDTARSQ